MWTFHDAPKPRSRRLWVALIALPVAAFVVGLVVAGADTSFDWPWWLWLLATMMFAALLDGFLRHVSRA
jgi:fatty acid desaturase